MIATPNWRHPDCERIAYLLAAAPGMLAALEAQEAASSFAADVSAATPDGEKVAKHLMDKAHLLFAKAANLRRGAISKATSRQPEGER